MLAGGDAVSFWLGLRVMTSDSNKLPFCVDRGVGEDIATLLGEYYKGTLNSAQDYVTFQTVMHEIMLEDFCLWTLVK